MECDHQAGGTIPGVNCNALVRHCSTALAAWPYPSEPNLLEQINLISHLICPLSVRVVGAPQMISQPVSFIFPCSPLPSHHHHQSFNREGRWGTTDDFATSFLHFSLFSTALWDLPNSRSVHSLMLSSHLFLCPPCLLPPFTVPCKMVLVRPDERET